MTTAPTYFEQYKESTIEEIKRLKALAELTEILQRTDLQRDMGVKSRERAQAAVAHQEASARVAKIAADRETRQEEANLANDIYYHRYYFDDPVTAQSVGVCMSILTKWSREPGPPCNMSIVFSSEGGDVVHGFALFDFVCQLRSKGHTVHTSVLGGAFSMAAVLLQCGSLGERSMGRESWLMLHGGSMGVRGTQGQVQDQVEWSKLMVKRMINIIATRAEEVKPDTEFRELLVKNIMTERKDWWLSSEEALEYGLVDSVI